ncbi:MAG: acetyl-CoA carboxylase carboxyltransferase subunit alpha [bacterium]|nr:acetyl-CoA carboxylase carboxyltransferase subunit alpha [bacterium]
MTGSLPFETPIDELEERINSLSTVSSEKTKEEARQLQKEYEELIQRIFSSLTPWQKTQLARHIRRPCILDYIPRIFDEFIELHGDRLIGDDRAIITGMARLNDETVFIIAHQKGKDTPTNIACNFGMPNPEGYRKAARIMRLAERFKKPILTFIDTPGAYPGIEAEEKGQGEAIARNLFILSGLKTPVIATVIGEGGSGGALAIGVADKVLMLENAVYSVISPEGCAAILWKDRSRTEEAAATLHLTAKDLLELQIIDEIIPEPAGGAHRNYDEAAQKIKKVITRHLNKLKNIDIPALLEKRYEKYQKMGKFIVE